MNYSLQEEAVTHNFTLISLFLKGYDTVCEEDEVVISESQKLRIVIARAIIRGSPIVVLEELLQEEEVRAHVS